MFARPSASGSASGSPGAVRTLLLAGIAACGAASPSPTRSGETAVTLLEPGAEPRRVVRYDLALGSRARAELTSKATVTAAITSTVLETGLQKTAFPTERTRVTAEVRERRPSGDVKIASVIDEVVVDDDGAVDARQRGQLQADAMRQHGRKTAWWMTPAGAVEPVEDETGEPRLAVTELVKLTIQHQTVRFPTQAIGVGATWRVVTRPKLEGVVWERIETYRVRGLTEDAATIESEVVMKADAQPLTIEPNATTTLKSATIRSTGKLVVALRDLVGEAYGETSGEVNVLVTNRDLRVSASTQVTSAFTAKVLSSSGSGDLGIEPRPGSVSPSRSEPRLDGRIGPTPRQHTRERW